MSDTSGAARARRVAAAGHIGGADIVLAAVDDPDPAVRCVALRALVRLAHPEIRRALGLALGDRQPVVRRAAAELCVNADTPTPLVLLDDPDETVVEAAAFALGERGERQDGVSRAAHRLATVAQTHHDELCREAAVAALGAIGLPDSSPVVVAAMADRPGVRRRAVVALTAFDDPGARGALEGARADRDRQVRAIAADLLGVEGDQPDSSTAATSDQPNPSGSAPPTS